MDEYINQIQEINEIIKNYEHIQEETAKKEYIESKMPEIDKFKHSLSIILRKYQFKENGKENQNKISDILKENIVGLLNINGVFENNDVQLYLKSELLEALSFNENRFAFNLQYEKGMDKIQSALQYMHEREEYVKAIKDNNYFEGEDLNEGEARKYTKEEFAQNIYGHILIQIKNNYLNLPEDEIKEIIEQIDKTTYFKEVLEKPYKDMNFYEKNLVYQYAETVIKIKSIFTPDKLKNDIAIQQMINGKIEDEKTLEKIVNNLSTKSILDISEIDEKSGLIEGMVGNLKNANMSEKNIALIMKKMLESGVLKHEVAKFLAQIDVPATYEEFINSKYFEENEWLSYCDVFCEIKATEKMIEDAKYPFLPVEYYVKKIDKIKEFPDTSKDFIGNLYTLLKSNYYTEEEKKTLNEALTRNGYVQEEPTNKIDRFKSNVRKYVSGYLKKIKGIDIDGKVFFGRGYGTNLGYYNPSEKAIWFDEDLVEKTVNPKDLKEESGIYRTMFHEMHHAVQYDNIEKGKIDYLTYNFIKEETILDYDMDFYSENYEKIYMESDARKEEILGSLEFFKKINPEIVEILKKDMEYDYVKESRTHTVYNDAQKKFSIGKNSTIDVSDYVGRLIKNNPQILTEQPMLKIEYNRDGSRKDVETLLKQFELFKNTKSYKNMYSIYYGLIQNSIKGDEPPELKEQIDEFMQKDEELVTMEDMHNCYHSVDLSHIKQLYSRLFSITRDMKEVKEKDEEDKEVR